MVPGLISQIGVTSRNFTVLSFIERELNAVSPAAEIVAFKHNKVYVEVHSSVHLHELTLRKRDLLQNIKKQLPIQETESLEIRFFLRGMARLNAQERLKWNPARKLKSQVERSQYQPRVLKSGS